MAATRHRRERAVRTSIHAWRLTPLEFPRSVHGHGETQFDPCGHLGATRLHENHQNEAKSERARLTKGICGEGPGRGPRMAFASTPCLGRESTLVLRRCQIDPPSRKLGRG